LASNLYSFVTGNGSVEPKLPAAMNNDLKNFRRLQKVMRKSVGDSGNDDGTLTPAMGGEEQGGGTEFEPEGFLRHAARKRRLRP